MCSAVSGLISRAMPDPGGCGIRNEELPDGGNGVWSGSESRALGGSMPRRLRDGDGVGGSRFPLIRVVLRLKRDGLGGVGADGVIGRDGKIVLLYGTGFRYEGDREGGVVVGRASVVVVS